jgi:4-hydroxyphenylpyruvate dioxygenase-like putative hemolysin
MLSNRSIPRAIVIPVLLIAYPDVNQAAEWLCSAFGFSVRLRIGNHRVQLNVGDGAVIVREMRPNEVHAKLGIGHSVTVRVEDADAHCKRARDHGARITEDTGYSPLRRAAIQRGGLCRTLMDFFAVHGIYTSRRVGWDSRTSRRGLPKNS